IARVFVRGPRGAAVVDRLTSIVLDRSRHETLRAAALHVIRTLEPATIAPLIARLADDPGAAIADERARRTRPKSEERERFRRAIADAAERGLGDDPAVLRAAIANASPDVPLEQLVRIVDCVREREGAEPPTKRGRWRQLRMTTHVALAKRGSRLALYDLRESLEHRLDAMPVEMMTALSLIGDASCLEAIAAAHAGTRDSWWRQHLADAFYTIVSREKLTQRHAVMRRVAKKWTLA